MNKRIMVYNLMKSELHRIEVVMKIEI